MFRAIYIGYRKQQMIFYTFENLIDSAIFFLFLIFIVITYRINLEGTWFRTYSDLEESEIFRESYLKDDINEDTLIVICGIVLWIKVFYSLRLTPFIGPIFMLAYHIVFDLIGYFLLLIAALLILSAAGTLVFRDLNNFDTIEDSLVTLFENCWGEFSFSNAKNGRFGDAVGYIFLIFVVITIILILTNFLIALYASKYLHFNKHMKAIMMNEALKTRPISEADDTHSSLISGAFPLSSLNWISPAFMFIPRSPRIANEVFLHIQFLPIMIVVTLLYIVYNLVIWPITYLKLIPHKFALIFKKNVAYTGNASNRIGSFFLILILGLPLLFLNICVDCFYFLLHMYSTDLERVDDSLKHVPDMSMKTYHKLYTYLESNPSPYMSYERVASDIRDDLKVLDSIIQMLFPYRAILNTKQGQMHPEQIVNEYIIVK